MAVEWESNRHCNHRLCTLAILTAMHLMFPLLMNSCVVVHQYLKLFKTRRKYSCIDGERQFQMAKRSQAPGDATVLKRVFRDNFVIFRRRSKRIAYLESVNFSTCAYMQIFNFRDGHVTTFPHPSGPILPNAWSQTFQTSKRHTFRV